MAKWWEIEMAIKDAQDNIDWARSAVTELYPDDAPDYKDPALDQFLQNLDELNAKFKTVFSDEIKKAIDDEARADDEAEARADAMSY